MTDQESRSNHSTGWIALHRNDESLALLANHPNAFLLLTQIALRAKWKDCPITRLKAGQAFIGDWKEAGLHSEKAYRCAKEVLTRCQLASFKGANKGTIATLLDSTIFSLTPVPKGGHGDSLGADRGQPWGGQRATNHKDTKKHGHTEEDPAPNGPKQPSAKQDNPSRRTSDIEEQ